MATKKLNPPKTRNLPGIKILPKLRYVVLGVFKVKKKHINVTSYNMEPFNIKINHFDSRNLLQRPLSLSRPKSNDSLPLLPKKKGPIKEENKFRYQNILS